ncbi:hypothetical protein Y032_0042g717 [Ancylostoma ceylanicum]|uniref:SCP domain-containing protein n=1 Tax=Ancylostoma ceylanicum TaxID=53326 RepID=A0A016UH20_9BILA|nr:hypothetical protein Y032_0042g717 [Ancylostoma ceylanicum]
MIRSTALVVLALILLQTTTFSNGEEEFKKCTGLMEGVDGDGCPEQVRQPLYNKLKGKNDKLNQNCTLEGVTVISNNFNNEIAYRGEFGEIDGLIHLWYRENNNNELTFGKDDPLKGLDIPGFIEKVIKNWDNELDKVKQKTQFGCYLGVSFNYTLVCAFA